MISDKRSPEIWVVFANKNTRILFLINLRLLPNCPEPIKSADCIRLSFHLHQDAGFVELELTPLVRTQTQKQLTQVGCCMFCRAISAEPELLSL